MAQNSSHDAPWLTNTRTEMFSVYAENAWSSCPVVGAVESCSTHAGLQHWNFGSPKLLCVHGTKQVLAAAERSGRRSVSVTSWVSSAKYAGV